MEAGLSSRIRFRIVFVFFFAIVWMVPASAGDRRTTNFIVFAPTQQLADAVATEAERFRHELAVYWLGKPIPNWPQPCPIRVVAGPRLAAQGITSYNPSPVRDFQMEVVGTPQRILDSVLPHEVTHTIMATHFGRPLPRWADEGICTTVEHESERGKHEIKLREYLRNDRGIAMNRLFLLKEYPTDMLPMYAQGYSVCQFLIAQKGPRDFIRFLEDYVRYPSWTENVRKHYGYESLREFQEHWVAWVDSGSRDVSRFAKRGNREMGASTPIAKLNPPAAGTALASVVDDAWQHRGQELRQERDLTLTGPAVRQVSGATIAPPSVSNSGRYRSAQPREEQSFRR